MFQFPYKTLPQTYFLIDRVCLTGSGRSLLECYRQKLLIIKFKNCSFVALSKYLSHESETFNNCGGRALGRHFL